MARSAERKCGDVAKERSITAATPAASISAPQCYAPAISAAAASTAASISAAAGTLSRAAISDVSATTTTPSAVRAGRLRNADAFAVAFTDAFAARESAASLRDDGPSAASD